MKKYLLLLTGLAMLLSSCDAHFDFPDTSVKVGDVLCTDGEIVRLEQYAQSEKEAIAIVFYLNHDSEQEGSGYAVYLQDLEPVTFADSLGISQGTSCSLTSYDGNENTYRILSGGGCTSEMATVVLDLWRYGQSAYVPSVAQMRLLHSAKSAVNNSIEELGEQILPDSADECWYWTSTEVADQDAVKGWLFSLQSGTIQETPKIQRHKIRPIITINY